MTSDSGEGSYRIKITETKNRDTSSSNVQHSQEIANADNSEEKNAIKQKYEKHIKAKLTNYIRCNLKRCRKMKNIRERIV